MSGTAGVRDGRALALLFERERALSVGVEEEVMALEPQTLSLAPLAREAIEHLPPAEGFKLELPACQLEIVSPPCSGVGELEQHLLAARERLAQAVSGRLELASSGAHPFAGEEGALNAGGRYDGLRHEYGWSARRQLICGLHVHVALSGSARVLAVYNALRSYLPDIAALAANAPAYLGRDSGMASVRPAIAGLLPRQGVPPVLESWEQFARELDWGTRSGRLQSAREWWWELRPHPELGTLEVRAPDAQIEAGDAAAVAAFVWALVLWLADRHDAADLPAPAPSWRIAENRWSAARHGVTGQMLDLSSGAATATAERLHTLLEALRPRAQRIDAAVALERASELVAENGAQRQRLILCEHGAHELARQLCRSFLHRRPRPRRPSGP